MIYIDLLGPLKSTRESLERLSMSSPKLNREQQEEVESTLALCDKMISKIQLMDEELKQSSTMQPEQASS